MSYHEDPQAYVQQPVQGAPQDPNAGAYAYYPQTLPAQAPANYVPAARPATFPGMNVTAPAFWTGAVVGAGLTLLVTNERVQKTMVKAVSRVMAATSSGIEEMKEKYEDAKAEVEAEAAGK